LNNAGGVFHLAFRFSLASSYLFQSGSIQSTASNPGASEISALFSEYRIKKVEIMLNYTANNNDSSSNVNTTTLPVFVTAFIPNTDATQSESTMLQRGNSVIIQLGNARNDVGYTACIKPVPEKAVYQVSDAATAPSGNSPDFSDPWLDTGTPDVIHRGYDILMMAPPVTASQTIGTIVPLIRYTLEARGVA